MKIDMTKSNDGLIKRQRGKMGEQMSNKVRQFDMSIDSRVSLVLSSAVKEERTV